MRSQRKTMNAYIFHGSTPHATGDKFWYPWLAKELSSSGVKATVINLPKLSRQSLEESLAEIEDMNLYLCEQTILIGHSAGANLLLSMLEGLTITVSIALLVAGFCMPTATKEPTLKATYAWDKIRENAETFYFINSFNDPFNCNHKQGKAMFDQLGGKLILDNDKHYTKSKYPNTVESKESV